MQENTVQRPGRPKATDTILIGALIAGILDGADAAIFYKLAYGIPVGRLFQNIASGALGKIAFQAGWHTVILGVGLHLSIAIGAAAFYWIVSRFLTDVIRRPYVYGPLFGLGLFFFMQHVVLPLSALKPRTASMSAAELVDQLFSHTIFVGLPIALMATQSAGKQASRKK